MKERTIGRIHRNIPLYSNQGKLLTRFPLVAQVYAPATEGEFYPLKADTQVKIGDVLLIADQDIKTAPQF